MRLTRTRKRSAVAAGLTILAVGFPVVSATAAEISGSRLPFSIAASGSAEDKDRFKGQSSGKVKVCGDVPTNDRKTFSGTVREDKRFMPDPQIASMSRGYWESKGCGSSKSTNRGGTYYTTASWAGVSGSRAYGYVAAEN
ncbi:hypothetical protein [Streptomyces alkaliterrae]|uniref:Uncharacterized protein n=1 Tax=Streptomyces alkaliterrae TaxID=2213162 RepID=A0A5P0YVS5_9ACTN|nr:hypothetical protein [Streptomyces alkaliterrae]MBB1255460.1 hypothetical protein [Streptomyces alkaliterrae]MBB1257907.1 hypothetical protein [Streptomyces alkaliterrae]MQS04396.1 hypothetical protein [Streptomyces alkaliterrae]